MTIAISQDSNIKRSLEKVFEELDFKPGKRVGIKPNLCGRAPILPGENSSIEVMDVLIRILLDRGCEVKIVHGSILDADHAHLPFSTFWNGPGFTNTGHRIRSKSLISIILRQRKCKAMDFHFIYP